MPITLVDLLGQADQAFEEGRYSDCEKFAFQAVKLAPENLRANLLLGLVNAFDGRNSEAISYFLKILALNPESFEAEFWLSTLYRRQRDLGSAIIHAKRALALRSDSHSNYNLGVCYLESMRAKEAAEYLNRALSFTKNVPEIFLALGGAYQMSGRSQEAAQSFHTAASLAPNSIEAWLGLAQALVSASNLEPALYSCKKALELEPANPTVHLVTAGVLVESDMNKEAEPHLATVIRLDPQNDRALALQGQVLQSFGKFEEANQLLLRSIEINPNQGFAYYAYAYHNRLGEGDRPLLQQMLEAERSHLSPQELGHLAYAIGRCNEGLGDFELAMRYFDKANSLAKSNKFGDSEFDRKAFAARYDFLIETYSQAFLEKHRPKGNEDETPIFIVGMIRSGTTLAEQMLSSHSLIEAGGERSFWPRSLHQLPKSDEELKKLSILYLEELRRQFPNAWQAIDKMPKNYELLGPIHQALPNARIIHMRRNSVDTCISIYSTPNRVKLPYAHSRSDLVFAYRQYLRIIEHWRKVLPEDRFIEVDYEALVSDPEDQLRRILSFLGLEWESGVVEHHLNQRPTNTPSRWQVTQPLYSTSIERWRRYEPWLGEFSELLPLSL